MKGDSKVFRSKRERLAAAKNACSALAGQAARFGSALACLQSDVRVTEKSNPEHTSDSKNGKDQE